MDKKPDTIWVTKKSSFDGTRFEIEVYNDGSGASVVRKWKYRTSLKYKIIELLWAI